jgi:hypothetical protein
VNPVTDEKLIIGVWGESEHNHPNGIIASFDRLGRFSLRIMSVDLKGSKLPRLKFSSVNFAAVQLCGHWATCSTMERLKSEADRVLRLPRHERPHGWLIDQTYDPHREQYVLQMPTILHNTFVSKLVKEIEKMLHDLPDIRPDTRVLIENIQSMSGIELTVLDKDGKPNIRHEPDMMFMYKHAAFPVLVIEVSHPQKKKALVDLADNYILGTYGGIGVVVGIDLDHKQSKEATLSIWRLKNTNNDGEEEGEVIQVVDNQVNPSPIREIVA